MAPLISRANYIVIASETSILLVETVTGSLTPITIPLLPCEKTNKPEKSNSEQSEHVQQNQNCEDYSHIKTGTCLAISQCLSYLAACTSEKDLFVWKICTQELVHNWKTKRKVSALTFNSDGSQIIVADKAGDCFMFSLDSTDGCEKLMLGHLSMLLDVAISEDERFIVTSERDEKIRVSCFPNAYNIHTFCLGHTEFVSTLAILTPRLILSGSGDGTMRLWDFTQGTCLHTENVAPPDAADMESAVRTLTVFKASETLFVAAVILNKGEIVLIYKISTHEAPNYKFESHRLSFLSQPLAVAFVPDGDLFVLTDEPENPLHYFKRDTVFQYTSSDSKLIANLLADHKNILQDCVQSCNSDMKPLFKRWFDNVQAYRERKKERETTKSLPVTSPKRVRTE